MGLAINSFMRNVQDERNNVKIFILNSFTAKDANEDFSKICIAIN
ncbi:uncharacterized protein G2W53_028550 [Senna tora]|uniref:Uncharacterized protein n=1 Tax=Senna tora TaxID=362788 RepID=A0A834WCX9_9FABA|nr:uncharacterized protein G2W53_028550 [Senna tora]